MLEHVLKIEVLVVSLVFMSEFSLSNMPTCPWIHARDILFFRSLS